jgi:MFS family permease
VLLYPVYALLFAENGLSPAEISSLFAIWSVTAFVLEVPSGAWADAVSRRLLLMLGPVLTAAGFALWTFAPSYLSFAAGFVLWGAGSALRSGTLQALVYEGLARTGPGEGPAERSYARLIGRSEAVAATAVMVSTALAGPVLAAGGYPAVGVVSVAATLLGVPVAWALPEPRRERGRRERRPYAAVLRAGLAEARRAPGVRRALLLVSVLMGTGALDEYLPLLAESTGVGPVAVPLLLLLVTAGVTVGGWCAGRGGPRAEAPALAVAAGCLATGALVTASGHPAGMALVAVAFGVFQWATAAADARLQARLPDSARATVTSIAGFGSEVVSVLMYGGYAAGAQWAGAGPGLLLAVAAVPYAAVALALVRRRRRGRGRHDGGRHPVITGRE